MGALVELDRVTFSYRERHDREILPPLLSDFSMTIDPHEIVAMVGPSGCGKSTIARLIAGLLFPERGTVLFHGRPVSGPDRERGLIAQGDWCLPWFTVQGNIRLGLADKRTPPQ